MYGAVYEDSVLHKHAVFICLYMCVYVGHYRVYITINNLTFPIIISVH